MERVLQYLDDLDDVYAMAGLVMERVRRVLVALFIYTMLVTAALGGTWLAVVHPPLALAISLLLFVLLLYRSVTSPLTVAS
jgi:hypothetical protein